MRTVCRNSNPNQSKLAAHNLSLVMFILPGHGDCERTLPAFHDAAKLLRKDLTLGAFLVNCMETDFLCRVLCVCA
jgi:hypothetical protein